MNLNNDVVYRHLRLGPLHQLHSGPSRSLIRHHNRLHRSPPCVEFLRVRQPLHALSLDGYPGETERPKSCPCAMDSCNSEAEHSPNSDSKKGSHLSDLALT